MKETEKIVQTLDTEHSCAGIYYKEKFHFDNFEEHLSDAKYAWNHSSGLQPDEEYIYLKLFLGNTPLEEFSPDPVLMKETMDLLTSQKKSAIEARIDFSKLCFYDAIPEFLLSRWFEARDRAMQVVLKKKKRPEDYEILHKIHVLVTEISKNSLKVAEHQERIRYDMFSSATGRLTTQKGSFPILNIKKEQRQDISPQNDLFLEMDLNGAEIRTLLSLSGVEQPEEDIHLWNMKNLPPWVSRKEAKADFFAWLYNPASENRSYEKHYDKTVYLKHYDGSNIKTPFGRILPVEERKALNYLIQSTTSDIVLESAYKIMKFLERKRSFIAFTMHDSVILDFAKEDHAHVPKIKQLFESNRFGNFRSNINIGKNFGNLRELRI